MPSHLFAGNAKAGRFRQATSVTSITDWMRRPRNLRKGAYPACANYPR